MSGPKTNTLEQSVSFSFQINTCSQVSTPSIYSTVEALCSILRQKNHESVVKSVSQCVYNFEILSTVSLCIQTAS
jgi:hypothetical protein